MFCCMAGRLTMSSKYSQQELEQNAAIIFIMIEMPHVDITIIDKPGQVLTEHGLDLEDS